MCLYLCVHLERAYEAIHVCVLSPSSMPKGNIINLCANLCAIPAISLKFDRLWGVPELKYASYVVSSHLISLAWVFFFPFSFCNAGGYLRRRPPGTEKRTALTVRTVDTM